MKYKYYLFTLLALAATFWTTVNAATFIQNEDLAKTQQAIHDDLFIASNSVMIDQDVTEDVYTIGNTVNATNMIAGDIHAAGNLVQISGTVGDDILAVGNTVDLTAATSDDIFAAGNSVKVNVADVQGDVFAAGSNVTLSGNINGSVKAASDVLTIKRGTTINGNLTTYGKNEPTVEEGAVIKGERKHKKIEEPTGHQTRNQVGSWALSIIAWFVTAMVLFYVFPGLTREVASSALQKSGRSLGVGFLWLIAFVPAIILLLISTIGWILAIAGGLLTAVLIILASVFSAAVIGSWIMQKLFKRSGELTWQHLLVGVVIMQLLELIPVLGWLITIVLVILTFGSLLIVIWRLFRQSEEALPTTSV